MLEQEKYFQVIDNPTAPHFELEDPTGKSVRLSDFKDDIVVLHFIYASCPDICPLHSNKVAELQGMVNTAGMAEQVQFISITTDPKNDTADVLTNYGERHIFDPSNWKMLTKRRNSGALGLPTIGEWNLISAESLTFLDILVCSLSDLNDLYPTPNASTAKSRAPTTTNRLFIGELPIIN